MSKKTVKKAIFLSLATLACATSVVTFTGCESARPEVKMELSFNDKTYEVEYVLYRQLAPSTVDHFISLVENDYYDGMCIHNYDSSSKRMYTGAYFYDEAETETYGLKYASYYDIVKDYKDFSTTVWRGKTGTDGARPLYTLFGEFAKNEFSVKNGSLLQETFGSLTMYYTDKGSDANGVRVDVKPVNSNEWFKYDYQYNSATSEFFISLNTTAKTNEAYCTFATPTDKGKEVLEDLADDIADYIEATHQDDVDEFVSKCTVNINMDDEFVEEEQSATYAIPKKPIVIKQISVKKY